jgi:hypothetical protein
LVFKQDSCLEQILKQGAAELPHLAKQTVIPLGDFAEDILEFDQGGICLVNCLKLGHYQSSSQRKDVAGAVEVLHFVIQPSVYRVPRSANRVWRIALIALTLAIGG